jgi:hypothetical protein
VVAEAPEGKSSEWESIDERTCHGSLPDPSAAPFASTQPEVCSRLPLSAGE